LEQNLEKFFISAMAGRVSLVIMELPKDVQGLLVLAL
jgi:hypothetical protein